MLYLTTEARKAGVSPDTVRNRCRDGLVLLRRDSSSGRIGDDDVERIRKIYQGNLSRWPLGQEALPA